MVTLKCRNYLLSLSCLITAFIPLGLNAQNNVQNAAAAAAAAIVNAPKAEEESVKPNYWSTSADFDLGFNQTALFSWAAGGNNTATLGAGMDAKANYAQGLTSWKNRLQFNYGFLWSSDKKGLLQKNNDRLYLESKLTHKANKDSKWNYAAGLDFRTQFTVGYSDKGWQQVDGRWEGKKVSNIFAPAYLNLALGIEWVPKDWFTLNIAPATGGLIICLDDELRPSYGMKTLTDKPEEYRSALFQLGTQIKADVRMSINDNLRYETQFVLFYDYLYDYKSELSSSFPFRINWDNKISWMAAKYFKISLNTWMIYDPIVVFWDDSHTVSSHKLQFKEYFAISFSYSIKGKK